MSECFPKVLLGVLSIEIAISIVVLTHVGFVLGVFVVISFIAVSQILANHMMNENSMLLKHMNDLENIEIKFQKVLDSKPRTPNEDNASEIFKAISNTKG